MRVLFSSIFWGFLFILIGILLVLDNFFGYNIPIWGILWPIILIMIGIRIITGRNWHRRRTGQAIFDEAEIEVKEDKEDFNTIFGKGTYDLTKVDPKGKKPYLVELNTIFGTSTLKIDPKTPLKIKASCAFGNAKLPDGNSAAFGDAVYTTKSYNKDKPYVLVDANVVFGELSIQEV
jgi:predicted membrane protein